MADLSGRVALVTGGAGGLGRAVCRRLAADGAQVLVVDVDETSGPDLAEEIGGAFHRADVSDLDANHGMVRAALDRFGRLDLVHLNAGVSSLFGVDESFDLSLYRRVMGINLDGVVFGTHVALAVLAPGSAIVATASLAGLTSVPFDPLYAANKHAVVGLTRALGPALEPRGVRFNAVCPGFAESKIIDPIREMLGEQGIPIIPADRVAETVLTLLTGTMTGECWFVQAGRPAAPFGFRGIPGPRQEEAQ